MARVVLQPLTRVEGHGQVELLLHEGRLQQVRLALTEAPRLFEKLLIGRSAMEIPDLVCRICAICSAVHKLAALSAIERALAIDVPPPARLVRELLLLGGHLQSHALHLFCLILPDFTSQPSVLELVRRGDPLAAAGLELKAFGNRLQEVAGGRVIHPVNAILGGVAQLPAQAELSELQRTCASWLTRWPQLVEGFAAAASYPPSRPVAGTLLATGAPDCFALQGEDLFLSEGEALPATGYAGLLDEQSATHSRAKFANGARGPFLVGALARRRLWSQRSGRSEEVEPGVGIHSNNTAQLGEIGWTLARVRDLLAELQSTSGHAPLAVSPGPARPGVGTAAFEAPRGLLIHHYVIDDWGQVAVADIVTPTAINQLAMERQLFADLAGVDDEAELRSSAERIVRAYDPCISCAVHVIRGEKRETRDEKRKM